MNFEKIWQRQDIGDALRSELLRVGEKVLQRIVAAAQENNVSNVTEWCKRQPCWVDLKNSISVNLLPEPELISTAEAQDGRRTARGEQKITNEAEAQIHVVGRTAAYWKRMLEWGERSPAITPTDIDFLRLASQMTARKVPSGLQSQRLVQIEEKAFAEGFKK